MTTTPPNPRVSRLNSSTILNYMPNIGIIYDKTPMPISAIPHPNNFMKRNYDNHNI